MTLLIGRLRYVVLGRIVLALISTAKTCVHDDV